MQPLTLTLEGKKEGAWSTRAGRIDGALRNILRERKVG